MKVKEVQKMRRAIIYVLYSMSALLDDVAFYVIGNQVEEMGIIIKTKWCNHYY